MLNNLLFKLATKNGGHEIRSWTVYKLACWLYKHNVK